MSQFPGPNRLHSAYQQRRQVQHPFAHNPLLAHNSMFTQNLQSQRSQQMLQMQRLREAQLQRLKKAQEIKKLERLQAMKHLKDKKKIQEIVIKPVQIEKNNQDVIPDHENRDQVYQAYRNKKEKAWEKRTNQPYKNVLKNVLSEADYQKKYQKQDDLIVHRVTEADKDKDELDGEFEEFLDDLEIHDKELKVIYSTSKKAQHKKKFEYNNVSKYRLKENPSDHRELKGEHLEAYKKEQQRLEKGKKKKDEILEDLLEYLPEDERKDLEAEEAEDRHLLEELGVPTPPKKSSPITNQKIGRKPVRSKRAPTKTLSSKAPSTKVPSSKAPTRSQTRSPSRTSSRTSSRPSKKSSGVDDLLAGINLQE